MKENAAAKARRYLTEGRVIVEHIHRRHQVAARIRGEGAIYEAGWQPATGWYCNCPARSDRCCHLIALRLITAIDIEGTTP